MINPIGAYLLLAKLLLNDLLRFQLFRIQSTSSCHFHSGKLEQHLTLYLQQLIPVRHNGEKAKVTGFSRVNLFEGHGLDELSPVSSYPPLTHFDSPHAKANIFILNLYHEVASVAATRL